MTNLIKFDESFKFFNHKSPFSLKSEIFLAYRKKYSILPKSSHVLNLITVYQAFIDRVVQEVKAATQLQVELLQIDVKKSNIAPEEQNVMVIAKALFREYGIELKLVDKLSEPTVMIVSWNLDNPLFSHSSAQLLAFRNQNFLVDFKIRFKGNIFSTHKLVLASSCPFFKKIFNGEYKIAEEHVIPFDDVRIASIEAWIDYLYTGQITISEETVSDLIQFANYYNLGHLKQKCFGYLCITVNATNLVTFISYGLTYEMQGLEEALVESVQTEISLKNLEDFLILIQNYEIKNLDTFCLQQIENNFSIGYQHLNETSKLLEIADQWKTPKIKLICNHKFKSMDMQQPTFDLVLKWLALASEHKLIYAIEHCTRQIPGLLQQSQEILNDINQLLHVADQYHLGSIKEICTSLLKNRIEQEFEKISGMAQKFNLETLKQECEQVRNKASG